MPKRNKSGSNARTKKSRINKVENQDNKVNNPAMPLLMILIFVLVVSNAMFIFYFQDSISSIKGLDGVGDGDYNPEINTRDFSKVVNNVYFSLLPRTNYIYEGETEKGLERIEVYVTEDTRAVMGVETRVVWDRVWLNGDLIKDTKDWYAQDNQGNVWYFGEESKELIDGNVVSYAGSWEAGVDGAKPGIIMLGEPKQEEKYRQEYYKGEAEDMGEVLSLGETVETPYRTFYDCLKTKDWNPFEPGGDEHKYYCPTTGNLVLEVGLEDGERVELIDVQYDVEPTPEETHRQELKIKITEEEAKEIALKEVPGVVIDVSIEKNFGKPAYVVEIDAERGPETDVIVEIESGEIVEVER